MVALGIVGAVAGDPSTSVGGGAGGEATVVGVANCGLLVPLNCGLLVPSNSGLLVPSNCGLLVPSPGAGAIEVGGAVGCDAADEGPERRVVELDEVREGPLEPGRAPGVLHGDDDVVLGFVPGDDRRRGGDAGREATCLGGRRVRRHRPHDRPRSLAEHEDLRREPDHCRPSDRRAVPAHVAVGEVRRVARLLVEVALVADRRADHDVVTADAVLDGRARPRRVQAGVIGDQDQTAIGVRERIATLGARLELLGDGDEIITRHADRVELDDPATGRVPGQVDRVERRRRHDDPRLARPAP